MLIHKASAGFLVATLVSAHPAPANVRLDPLNTKAGYLTYLLINEAAFPGESSYANEADSMRCMGQILCVLNNRARNIPAGYTRERVAGTQSPDLIDLITARGQVEDFRRNAAGRYTAVPRVVARVERLVAIGNRVPRGATARLLNHAQLLARDYIQNHQTSNDSFSEVLHVGSIEVTGGVYAWMTAGQAHQPGGDFVAIPAHLGGVMGGNQFYTLRQKLPAKTPPGFSEMALNVSPLNRPGSP